MMTKNITIHLPHRLSAHRGRGG